MNKVKDVLNKIFYNKKYRTIFIAIFLLLIISIASPSLARHKNRNVLNGITVWDGSIANSYNGGDGTQDNPYVISNASQLAYFAKSLENTNYENTYFVLNNDIAINDGIFKLIDNNIEYIKGENTYYIKPYTNIYYDSLGFENDINNLNLFFTMDNFKGYFDGDSHTIFGLYLTEENVNDLALFTNLSGTVKNLYIENSLIYGGNVTAGLASRVYNSTIENILFDGYIKNDNINNATKEISLKNTTLTSEKIGETLKFSIPNLEGAVKKTTVTGKMILSGTTVENVDIYLADKLIDEEEFTVELDTTLLNEIEVRIDTLEDNVEVRFTDLKYIIEYEYSIAAGIVGISDNSSFSKIINKSDIYSNKSSAGLISIANNTNISYSYNTGLVSGVTSSGLINELKGNDKEYQVLNSYNSGNIEGNNKASFINNITSADIKLKNLFSTDSINYGLNNILDSNVTIDNSYIVSGKTLSSGTLDTSFKTTTLENLKSKTFATKLGYNEFVDLDKLVEDGTYMWIYEDDSLPILYIDDIVNPLANIYASTYSWNNLGFDLNKYNFGTKITFSIAPHDELRPLKEIYYYKSSSKEPLNMSELKSLDDSKWILYEGVTDITEEGFYVIYAKVIDYNDKVEYLNTDILVLDLSKATIDIAINDKKWKIYKEDVSNFYINDNPIISINATDELSGVESLHYYLSDDLLSLDELDELEESSWIVYKNNFSINKNEDKIIYVRAIDNCGIVSYANTDKIVYNGYAEGNITLGRNTSNTLNNIYITDKSTISFDFTYQDANGLEDGLTHNIISNTLLPVNTKFTLIDIINNKIYSYKISSSEDIYNYNSSCSDDSCRYATYPFELFKTGKVSADEYFNEADYKNSSVNEKFKLVLDFSETNINRNYDNVNIYLSLNDKNNKIVRSTLTDTIKTFNIYYNTAAALYLNTTFNNDFIEYNSNSNTNILINTGLTYKQINSNVVYDTTKENMNIGLTVKIVDSNGIIVNKKYLKNILLKIDNNEFAAEEDGIFRINLNAGVNNISKNLVVVTNRDNLKLKNGEYQMIINNYVSFDGTYTSNISSNQLIIPVIVSNSSLKINYLFDVLYNNQEDRIISKTELIKTLGFSIIQKGNFKNPNIKVSLYKKDKLNALNQDYSLVDLQDYVTNSLSSSEQEYVYNAILNPLKYNGNIKTYNNFQLDLVTSNFENTGYKLVFELYDGENCIGTIEKKFIVR